MTQPKLTYFDFSGSRGEECRLAFAVAGVDFEDDRLPRKSWPDVKPTTPFGGLPVLQLEGKGRIGECNAILTFIGRSHGLHPSDNWEAAQHEALMSACAQLRNQLSATMRIKDEEEKKSARHALAEGAIPSFGKSVEAHLGGGPFVAGQNINVVDIKMYMIVRWISSGGLDHVPDTSFSDFPRLMKLYNAVKDHPKVIAWIDGHS